MDPNQNNQNSMQRPIYIDPHPKKSRTPKILVWTLGCLGSCFGVLVIIILFFSIIIGVLSAGSMVTVNEQILKDGNPSTRIAVIPLNGIIVDDINQGADLFSLGAATSSNSSVEKLLDMASNDKTVEAIILRENTPGGSTLAMRKICKKLESVNKIKPIYTYIESEGASAGYYLANCTKYIIADEYSITGSIGALVEATDTQGLMDKLGIKTKVITNTKGTEKDSNIFESGSNIEQKLKALLDDTYENFVQQIVKGRNSYDGVSKISESAIRKLATGEVFSGKQAKLNGLVDDNGMFDDAITIMKSRETLSSDIQVVQYGYTQGFFSGASSLLKSITGLQSQITVTSTSIYAIRQ